MVGAVVLTEEWERTLESLYQSFKGNNQSEAITIRVYSTLPVFVKRGGLSLQLNSKQFHFHCSTVKYNEESKEYIITITTKKSQEKFKAWINTLYHCTGSTWSEKWIAMKDEEKRQTNSTRPPADPIHCNTPAISSPRVINKTISSTGKRSFESIDSSTLAANKKQRTANFSTLYQMDASTGEIVKEVAMGDARGILSHEQHIYVVDRNKGISCFEKAGLNEDHNRSIIWSQCYDSGGNELCLVKGQFFVSMETNCIGVHPMIHNTMCCPSIENIGQSPILDFPNGITRLGNTLYVANRSFVSEFPIFHNGTVGAPQIVQLNQNGTGGGCSGIVATRNYLFVLESSTNILWCIDERLPQGARTIPFDLAEYSIQSGAQGISIYEETEEIVSLLVADTQQSRIVKLEFRNGDSSLTYSVFRELEDQFPVKVHYSQGFVYCTAYTTAELPVKPPRDTIAITNEELDDILNLNFDAIFSNMSNINPSTSSDKDIGVHSIPGFVNSLRSVLQLMKFMMTLGHSNSQYRDKVIEALKRIYEQFENEEFVEYLRRFLSPSQCAKLHGFLSQYAKDKESPNGSDICLLLRCRNAKISQLAYGSIVAVYQDDSTFDLDVSDKNVCLGVKTWKPSTSIGLPKEGEGIIEKIAVCGTVYVRVYEPSTLEIDERGMFVVIDESQTEGIGRIVPFSALNNDSLRVLGKCSLQGLSTYFLKDPNDLPVEFSGEIQEGIVYTILELPDMQPQDCDNVLSLLGEELMPQDSVYESTMPKPQQTKDPIKDTLATILQSPLSPEIIPTLSPVEVRHFHTEGSPKIERKREIEESISNLRDTSNNELPMERKLEIEEGDDKHIMHKDSATIESVLHSKLISPFTKPDKKEQGFVARPVYTVTYVIFGRSGVGKSTFAREFMHMKHQPSTKTTEITPLDPCIIETREVIYEIIGIDTPGLGDDPRIEQTILPVVDLIRDRYSSGRHFFSSGERKTPIMYIFYILSDLRVNDHDMKAMRVLSKYGNIIPLIGKSDTFEPQELKDFQNMVHEQLKNTVPVLDLPWPFPRIPIPATLAFEWKFPYPIIGRTRRYDWGKEQSDVRVTWDDYNINATKILRKSLFTPDEVVPPCNSLIAQDLGLPPNYKGSKKIINIYLKYFKGFGLMDFKFKATRLYWKHPKKLFCAIVLLCNFIILWFVFGMLGI